jgi:putative tricarboxylic transport membrane protein
VIRRNRFLFAVFLVAAGSAAGPAATQGFKPTRPVELVVHTGPGGGNDVLARAITAIVEKENLLPVRMQVANKTGGGGLSAMAYLVEKKGDTHTIALFANTWFTVPAMRAEAKVTMGDLSPIARLVVEPAVIAVKNDASYRSLNDFIEAARMSPGQLKQSGGSIGSRDWVMRQLLMKHTGANWTFISFPGGGERIAALLGGHVNMMVIEPQEAGEHIRSGNMRVLAQISDRRLPPFRYSDAKKPGSTFLRTRSFAAWSGRRACLPTLSRTGRTSSPAWRRPRRGKNTSRTTCSRTASRKAPSSRSSWPSSRRRYAAY